MKNESINILLTGDFCPINRVEELCLKEDYKHIFNDFIDVFRNNDLNIVDLECPLTSTDKSRPKTGPYQKAKPIAINALSYAGVKLVAMANNHIMDYGTKGVEETFELLKDNDIASIGIGKSKVAAAEPYILDTKSKKIAILNFADNEFLSTPDGAYTCNALDLMDCYYHLMQAQKNNDYVIAIVHAGNEFYHLPSPRTKKIYRYLTDLGADVVISHHTHAYSGYEIYNGKPIFYGLGNFVYDWPGKRNSDWNKGYVVKLTISNTIEFDIVPLKQGNETPGVFKLTEQEKQEFRDNLERLNEIISDDTKLENEFNAYCSALYPMYDAFIEPYFGKYITALQKRGFLPKLLSKKKRLYHLNLSRCESHRDVLLRMLKRYEQLS